jgi:hypothetical protein
VGNARVISVGAETTANYLAFGDDSQFGRVLAYAVIIVRRTRLSQVEARITTLKERYKIPAQVQLHCRVLFNKHPRKRAGLAHLSDDDARSIVARAVTIMNQGNVILRYAFGDLPHFEHVIGNELEFTHESDGSKLKLAANPDAKGVLGMMMQACFAVPADGSHGPPVSECQIFVSEDSTKITFIGPGRRRADQLYSGFSDIGATDGSVFQLQPTILSRTSRNQTG